VIQETQGKKIEVEINEDLYNYLEFLERTLFIKNIQCGLHKALTFFKKLSMHEWLPEIYRIGGDRVMIIERGMFLDIFESLSKYDIYRLGSMTALKRKVIKNEFRGINLTKRKNWPIILNELSNYGWGYFELIEDEIRIEHAAIPEPYIRGYLETLFKIKLNIHEVKKDDLIIYNISKPKMEIWL
jgi:hypothetical protein